MTIIVEDGTGLSTAETYITVAEFKAYCDARGHSYSGYTDLQIEQAMRRAATYINSLNYYGSVVSDDQGMAWPRRYLTNIESNVVPRQIKWAQAEATLRELASPGAMFPDLERGGQIIQKTESVDGVVSESVTYAAGASASTVFTIIDRMLAGFLAGGGSGVTYLRRA